jgi:hypothetical protein
MMQIVGSRKLMIGKWPFSTHDRNRESGTQEKRCRIGHSDEKHASGFRSVQQQPATEHLEMRMVMVMVRHTTVVCTQMEATRPDFYCQVLIIEYTENIYNNQSIHTHFTNQT